MVTCDQFPEGLLCRPLAAKKQAQEMLSIWEGGRFRYVEQPPGAAGLRAAPAAHMQQHTQAVGCQ